jgi:hypothetical protein
MIEPYVLWRHIRKDIETMDHDKKDNVIQGEFPKRDTTVVGVDTDEKIS